MDVLDLPTLRRPVLVNPAFVDQGLEGVLVVVVVDPPDAFTSE